MLTKNKVYITGIVLLFAILIVIQHFAPKPVDWEPSFSGNRKSPYACSVIRDLINVLFPGKNSVTNTTSFYTALNQNSYGNNNLIIINDNFAPDDLDLAALLEFAAKGNTVFISTLIFPDKLCDTLHFKTDMPVIDTALLKQDKENLKLYDLNHGGDSSFVFRKRMPNNNFTSFDTLHSLVLGSNRAGKVNYILMHFGEGRIFLHCQPLAFTNFHVLYSNYQYACKALSYLPVVNTIWDQYYKPGTILNLSPVRYILSEPALRSAYYLVLIILLVYMTIGAKRKQRAIPVIRPEQNASLNFVKTVGQLYYKSQNHTDLAKKKIVYFHEFIRNHYYYKEFIGSDEQIKTLSLKSGVDAEDIKNLLQATGAIENTISINRERLIELHKLLEDFYKKCK